MNYNIIIVYLTMSCVIMEPPIKDTWCYGHNQNKLYYSRSKYWLQDILSLGNLGQILSSLSHLSCSFTDSPILECTVIIRSVELKVDKPWDAITASGVSGL